MKILALDLARQTGFAVGDAADPKPVSWSASLGSPGEVGLQCGEIARQINLAIANHGRPDLVCIERWMAPFGQKSQANVESALRLNGAAHAIVGGVHRIPIVEPAADTVRAAVCGQKNAGDRDATKRMVVRTAQMLGMLGPEAKDDNRADAVLLWAWAVSTHGKRWPGAFELRAVP